MTEDATSQPATEHLANLLTPKACNLLNPRDFLLVEARNLRTWAANADRHAKEYPGVADDLKRKAITLRGAAADFEAAAALIPEVE